MSAVSEYRSSLDNVLLQSVFSVPRRWSNLEDMFFFVMAFSTLYFCSFTFFFFLTDSVG